MLQFPRWKVDVTVGGDLVKTFYETATTATAAIGKAKHKMRGAVSNAGAFKFKATKAEADPLKRDLEKEFLAGAPMPVFDTPRGKRSHATKKKTPAQLDAEILEALSTRLTPAQHAYVLAVEESIRLDPSSFNAGFLAEVRANPASALRDVDGLSEDELRRMARELRAETKLVARRTGR